LLSGDTGTRGILLAGSIRLFLLLHGVEACIVGARLAARFARGA
jgi:hypothetical protein